MGYPYVHIYTAFDQTNFEKNKSLGGGGGGEGGGGGGGVALESWVQGIGLPLKAFWGWSHT